VCIQFVQQKHFDDVDSTVIDKLINESDVLLDGLEKPRGHQAHQVPVFLRSRA
jgi:hypothetical protein